jgi:hypothetical protein
MNPLDGARDHLIAAAHDRPVRFSRFATFFESPSRRYG